MVFLYNLSGFPAILGCRSTIYYRADTAVMSCNKRIGAHHTVSETVSSVKSHLLLELQNAGIIPIVDGNFMTVRNV